MPDSATVRNIAISAGDAVDLVPLQQLDKAFVEYFLNALDTAKRRKFAKLVHDYMQEFEYEKAKQGLLDILGE